MYSKFKLAISIALLAGLTAGCAALTSSGSMSDSGIKCMAAGTTGATVVGAAVLGPLGAVVGYYVGSATSGYTCADDTKPLFSRK